MNVGCPDFFLALHDLLSLCDIANQNRRHSLESQGGKIFRGNNNESFGCYSICELPFNLPPHGGLIESL